MRYYFAVHIFIFSIAQKPSHFDEMKYTIVFAEAQWELRTDFAHTERERKSNDMTESQIKCIFQSKWPIGNSIRLYIKCAYKY